MAHDMSKTGLAGLIALATSLPLWTSAALAASGRADYDLDNDGLIEIDDLDDLNEVRNNPNGTTLYGTNVGCPAGGCFGFELSQDLDFDTNGDGVFDSSDSHWTPPVGWPPIAIFNGTFEGNGHTIHHLVVNVGPDFLGLFAVLEGALVQNLGLATARLAAGGTGDPTQTGTGVLAGSIANSTIRGCHAIGQEGQPADTAFSSVVGGLIGACLNSNVDESYAQVDIVAGNLLGGLVAWGDGCVIRRSFATGRVASRVKRSDAGGLVGMLSGGGIQASFATGNVANAKSAGALLGTASGPTTIVNSFATGNIVGPEIPRGGLIGSAPGGATVVNSYWATDTTGQTQSAGTGAQGFTLAELQCPTLPSDPACRSGLFSGWGAELNAASQPVWDFGSNQQLPGLRIQGSLFRDADGDATLDGADAYPLQYAASSNADGDIAHDRWKEGCDAACRQVSGLILDQFPNNAAASIDLDLDGRPDAWNPGCASACQAASGLTLDPSLNDQDNDFVTDPVDLDDNGDGVADADGDSDGLVDIATTAELFAMRFELSGSSQRLSEGGASDISGCPPTLFDGVLVRRCQGYELITDLNFDANGNGTLSDDAFWNGGAGWEAIGRAADDPQDAFHTVLEGNGHTIYNLMIDTSNSQQGLLGGAIDAVVRHLGFSGPLMSIHAEGGSVGALVGQAQNLEVRGVYSTGPISSGSTDAGGLIGSVSNSTIVGSLSTGTVTALNDCGGFCRMGGLVGSTTNSLLSACFATGNVSGQGGQVGGLAGQAIDGTIVSGCYATGLVTATNPGGGGLIGQRTDGQSDDPVIVNSYWAVDHSGQPTSAGIPAPVAATLAQLECPVAADDTACAPVPLYVNWNSYLDESSNRYWDFGDPIQLPGLCIAGKLYRDGNADGVLEAPTPCPCTQTEQQLVTNQGFESGTTSWVASFGTTISSSTAQAHSGARSLRIANRNLGTWQGAEYNLLGLAAPGGTLTANLWARIEGDPSEPVLFTLRSTCQGAARVFTTVASGTATNTAWRQIQGIVQVPNCTLSELVVYAEGPRTGVVLYIDDVSVKRTLRQCGGGQTPLTGTFIVTTDWGTGYCVELRVTNPNTVPTSNWSATFNLNGTTIYNIWNLDRTGLSGTVTVSPNAPWSRVIPSGGSTNSLGFCANRPAGNSALPSGLVVVGTF